MEWCARRGGGRGPVPRGPRTGLSCAGSVVFCTGPLCWVLLATSLSITVKASGKATIPAPVAR